jgi:hypothetical protein
MVDIMMTASPKQAHSWAFDSRSTCAMMATLRVDAKPAVWLAAKRTVAQHGSLLGQKQRVARLNLTHGARPSDNQDFRKTSCVAGRECGSRAESGSVFLGVCRGAVMFRHDCVAPGGTH